MNAEKTENTLSNDQRWPWIPAAYEFVLPSYNWAIQRLDAVDARLQTMQAFAATLTFAAPVLIKALAPNAALTSPLFGASIALFIVIAVAGTAIRAHGSVWVPSPKLLLAQTGETSEWEFKKNMLHVAGEDMERNRALVNSRGRAADGLAGVLAIETLLLLAWGLTEI